MNIINLPDREERIRAKQRFEMPNFDTREACRIVDMVYQTAGINCVLLDSDGELLYSCREEETGCTFCQTLENLIGQSLNCRNVHRYGIYQAERFHGKYVFFCPLGLVHVVSPLIINSSLEAAFLAGPVFLNDRRDFLTDIKGKYEIPDEKMELLRDQISKIPRVDHAKLSNLTELLYFLSSHFSEDESKKLDSQKEEAEKINEYIADHLPYLQSMGGDTYANQYPIEKERELLQLISVGDKAGAKRVLNEILGHVFFSSANNFNMVKARVLELVVLLSRAALQGGASVEEIFGLNYKYLNDIDNFRNVDQLATWLARIMGRFTDCVFDLKDVKHVDVIYKALDFIKKNYMNKISLTDVAQVSNISPSYFSKVFKEEMGMNFNNYLNELRVNMSKRLLLDDSIPLVDVAFMTGFEDQSYFSKVFKKVTGSSPGKYRESMGRLLSEKTG
jgi:AraC-like DNA-binding protein/ligand-binding sensor protein